jgi:hypothetical protein
MLSPYIIINTIGTRHFACEIDNDRLSQQKQQTILPFYHLIEEVKKIPDDYTKSK